MACSTRITSGRAPSLIDSSPKHSLSGGLRPPGSAVRSPWSVVRSSKPKTKSQVRGSGLQSRVPGLGANRGPHRFPATTNEETRTEVRAVDMPGRASSR